MTDPQPASGHVSVLKLDVIGGENPDWPQVRILIDGHDLFGVVAPGWLGFDPDDILGVPTSPLLPEVGDHRVAVHRCSCGEAGCGVIAPVISLSRDGRFVVWRDFKDYTGVFVRPTTSYPNVDVIPCRQWNVPDLRFEREQYAAAIATASQDRSWETPRRQTARLMHEQLSRRHLMLPPDLPLQAVFPEWEGDGFIVRFGVEFEDSTVHLEDLRLNGADDQDPAGGAQQMADQLRSTPPKDWLRVFAAY